MALTVNHPYYTNTSSNPSTYSNYSLHRASDLLVNIYRCNLYYFILLICFLLF